MICRAQDGWRFLLVSLLVHKRMNLNRDCTRRLCAKYRIKQGSIRELFRCSMLVYEAVTEAEYEFITANEPDTEAEEIERAKQEEAKRAGAT